MWHSNKGDAEGVDPIALGAGVYCVGKAKTGDKAIKNYKVIQLGIKKARERARKTNSKLLEQKFFLKEQEMEYLFVLDCGT